jgi:hypothetical protein
MHIYHLKARNFGRAVRSGTMEGAYCSNLRFLICRTSQFNQNTLLQHLTPALTAPCSHLRRSRRVDMELLVLNSRVLRKRTRHMPRGINFPTLPCLSPESVNDYWLRDGITAIQCHLRRLWEYYPASKHAHKAVSQDNPAMWLDNAYTCIRKRDDR